jgi:hypothetical protein
MSVVCAGEWRRTCAVFAGFCASDRAWEYFLPLMLSSILGGPGDGTTAGLLSASAALYLVRTAVAIVAMPLASRCCWRSTPVLACAFLAVKQACLIASAAALWSLSARGEPSFTFLIDHSYKRYIHVHIVPRFYMRTLMQICVLVQPHGCTNLVTCLLCALSYSYVCTVLYI